MWRPVRPVNSLGTDLRGGIHLPSAFPENTAFYQREILFGAEEGQYRTEALTRISELEKAIGDILRRFTSTLRAGPGVDLNGAARTTFSTLHMELIRVSIGREDPETLTATLRSHVDVLLYGVLAPR